MKTWMMILGLTCGCVALGCGKAASHPEGSGAGGSGTTTSTTTTTSASGTGGTGGAALTADLFVDALGGADANPGTEQKPFKTLKKALSVAESGQTVHLYSGTYDASNGESYPEDVPDGVSIAAVAAGDAVLVGESTLTALQFAGSGGLSYLRLQGFRTAISAASGKQNLLGVELLQDDTAVSLSGDARASLSTCSISGGGQAFDLRDASLLIMSGGEIHDLGPSCSGGVGIGTLLSASDLTLDAVNVHDIGGDLSLRDASLATIKNSTIKNVGTGTCGSDVFRLDESSSLSLEATSISGVSDTAVLITGGGASVHVQGGSISAQTFAIRIDADAEVTVDGTTFSKESGTGTSTGLYLSSPGASVSLTNAVVDSFTYGIEMGAGSVKVRSTKIGHCFYGISFFGGNLDLGSGDAGANTLQTNTDTALYVNPTASATINAVGNFWLPNVQGANATGQYLGGTLIGPYGSNAPAPRNTVIEQAGSQVEH